MQSKSKNFLIRDKYSKAILNTNVDEVKEYNFKKNNNNRVTNLQLELNNLKNELEQIKKLLEKNK